jgi:cation diffusion facilitator family transporter
MATVAPAAATDAWPFGEAAARDRRRAARLSVAAAVFLVALKLVAGLASGSLGLLAEAAHSGTDLVAALLTLVAIRVALRPADRQHQYGHGKAEHLAALGESSFLVLVSLALGAQAVVRLASGDAHEVDTAWWTFGVLGLVIVIDLTRTVALRRAARRLDSPALASNALHFAGDLGGSLAVLVGLAVTAATGEAAADSIAALVVAAIVLVAAGRLAAQSVDVLMDRASAEADEAIRAAIVEAGVPVELRRVRARQAAGRHFVDLVAEVPADAGLGQAHGTADLVEDAIRSRLPGADVVVHLEPAAAEGDLRERATAAALGVPEVREVHNVRVMHVGGRFELSMHVKFPRELSVGAAHDIAERLETRIRGEVPQLAVVHTHIEPLAEVDWATTPTDGEVAASRGAIDEVVERYTGLRPAAVAFRDGGRGRVALVDVLLPADQPLPVAHRRAGVIEAAVRERCPELADVIVHTEPAPGALDAPPPQGR